MNWKPTKFKRGILAACDEKLEWLLPWWWERLRVHSETPVAFVDFGMSACGRSFCQERGELIALDISQFKESVAKERAVRWEAIYGKGLWNARQSWLKKPFALLLTPFKETIWLDLDCEVLGPLVPLFEALKEADLALAQETENAILHERMYGELNEDELLYNSGVIAYRHGTPLIEQWAEETILRGDKFWGDQQLLSRLIYEKKASIAELDPHYNWRMSQGFNLHAQIIHWVGSWGKEYIRLHGGLGEELGKLPKI